MDLADLVYTLTEPLPPRERLGLAFQMRKAAVSIASNIALAIFRASSSLWGNMRNSDMTTFEQLSESVGQLAHGLARSLETRISDSQR